MAEEPVIPDNVKSLPADEHGDGFIIPGDIRVHSVVGSDGECYVRKNNVISIAPVEDDESEDE